MTDSLARAPREKAPSPPRKARGRGRGDTTRSPLKKAEPAPAFPIDLDRATVKEIEALPRIGPALAARIVSEREANGPFLSMDAFDKRVKGIGPSMAAAIRPLVTFSGR